MRPALRPLLVAPLLALSACIYLPQTSSRHDYRCNIVERRMTLQEHQVGVLTSCNIDDCAAALALFGAVSAASAVISGSIVIIGNAVYWLEEQARCIP